jgi:hypothetical protein
MPGTRQKLQFNKANKGEKMSRKRETKEDVKKAAQKVFSQIKRDIDQIIENEKLKQKDVEAEIDWDRAIRSAPVKPGIRYSSSLQHLAA